MTQLMGRPIPGLSEDAGDRPVLTDVLAGVRTALLACAVIAVPVLGLWVLTPYPDVTAAGALRLACALWLLGHAAPLTRGPAGVPFTLTPLLLTAVSLVLLRRAGARAARRGRTAARRSGLGVWAGYVGVGALAVADCAGGGAVLRARPVPDLLAVAVLAAAGVAWGRCAALGPPRLPPAIASLGRRRPGRDATDHPDTMGVHGGPFPHREPDDLHAPFGGTRWTRADGAGGAVTAAVAAGLSGLAAAGGALLLAAIAAGHAGRSAAALADGPAGLLGLLLACVLLIPNAVVWAASYALGPGFAVGAEVLVSPLGGRAGALPDFPLLALLPDPAVAGHPGWRLALAVLPLSAGVVPALLLGRAAAGATRRRGPAEPWHPAAGLLAATATALATGAAGAAAAWLSGGSPAGGRMAGFGPVPWQAGAAAAAWSAAVTVPGVLLARWWLLRGRPAVPSAPPPADRSPGVVHRLGAWFGYGRAVVPSRQAGDAFHGEAGVRGGVRVGVLTRATAVARRRAAPVRRAFHTAVHALAGPRRPGTGRVGRVGRAEEADPGL